MEWIMFCLWKEANKSGFLCMTREQFTCDRLHSVCEVSVAYQIYNKNVEQCSRPRLCYEIEKMMVFKLKIQKWKNESCLDNDI